MEERTALAAAAPGFAFATVLILVLGMGASTTLYSLVDAVLWKPLPYPGSDRLVTIYEGNPAKNQNTSLLAPVRHRMGRARLGGHIRAV